jgi:NAD(P)-dependent dehydrogenase (short-subunit alcohol dehydrogenase family)
MAARGRLAGKSVLVTGAAKGIGAAIARACAEAGAEVVLTDVQEDVAASAAAIARDLPSARVHALRLDVSRREEWENVVRTLSERGIDLNGLVNNAGINVKHEPLAMPDADWDRCLDVNLRGAWYGAQAVLPQMLARGGGSIVNIASVHGHAIIPGSFPYPVSKHGLIGLTRALGVEYARRGVRVNAVSPGYVDTGLVRDWWAAQEDPVAAARATLDLIPAGRIADPREVAMTCVFLLSDEAPSITAAVLPVDGGSLAQFHP